jgi:hypothetical protein
MAFRKHAPVLGFSCSKLNKLYKASFGLARVVVPHVFSQLSNIGT